MKRRQFMANSLAAGLGTIGMSACGLNKLQAGENLDSFIFNSEHDPELLGLRNRYKTDLFDSFLPHMDKFVVDHQFGGFMCSVDIHTGLHVSTNKSAWFEGRGMWTYAFLYNNLSKDPHYLEIARKSKDFILKSSPKGQDFWTSSFTREGAALSGPGDIYSSLFVAEGLAEYAKASGEGEYFQLAKRIILSCLDRYDSPEYDYQVAYLNKQASKVPAPRVLGHWMVFLRAATQILENAADADIQMVADRSLDAILNHHLNPEYGLFNEVLNHDLSRPANEFRDFAYMGHGIETCWMLLFEAARRKDSKLFNRVSEIFKRHLMVAHDQVYGGYFRSLDHVPENVWKVDKVLWLQEEVLIGTLFVMEHTGDNWAKSRFLETYDYVQQKFKKPGALFWTSAGDRTLEEYSRVRAEHYHHPRHLMLNLLALNRIIERRGRTSQLFQ